MVVKMVLRPIDKLSEFCRCPALSRLFLRRELHLDSRLLAWMNGRAIVGFSGVGDQTEGATEAMICTRARIQDHPRR
jgi:hypothetical protein